MTYKHVIIYNKITVTNCYQDLFTEINIFIVHVKMQTGLFQGFKTDVSGNITKVFYTIYYLLFNDPIVSFLYFQRNSPEKNNSNFLLEVSFDGCVLNCNICYHFKLS